MSENSPHLGSTGQESDASNPLPSYENHLSVVVQSFEVAVADQRDGLVQYYSDQAQDIYIWDKVTPAIAANAYDQSMALLDGLEESWAGKEAGDGIDPIEGVLIEIAEDVYGTTGLYTQIPGPDKIDFVSGSSLVELIESEQLDDSAMLSKMTSTLHLLGQYGLYKLAKYQNAKQLTQTLQLMEALTRKNPAFEVRLAGYKELVSSAVVARAALLADTQTKSSEINSDMNSNLPDAKVNQILLMTATDEALISLAKMQVNMVRRMDLGSSTAEA